LLLLPFFSLLKVGERIRHMTIEIGRPVLSVAQLTRKAFVENYNKGSKGNKSVSAKAESEEIIGVGTMQLNLLSAEELLLSDEEQDALISVRLDGLVNAFIAGYDWLLDAQVFAYTQVPDVVPGEESDPSVEDRKWTWTLDSRFASDTRTYTATLRKECQPGTLQAVAVVRLGQIWSGAAGDSMIADVIAANPEVEDVELFGQVLLPANEGGYNIRCNGRLRCEEVRVEAQIPEVPEPPLPE
jgi:hypothetical protein